MIIKGMGGLGLNECCSSGNITRDFASPMDENLSL
jgi:hypothetical protein